MPWDIPERRHRVLASAVAERRTAREGAEGAVHRQVAGRLTGRRTKWVALGLWIIVMVLASPLASKLSSVEKNNEDSYLPASAESTRALVAQERFRAADTLTAVVVYNRPGGLTAADVAKARADARQFARLPQLQGKVVGPLPSTDRQALETFVPLTLGTAGWFKAVDIIDGMRHTAGTGDPGLHAHLTGPAGYAADSGKAFQGIEGKLLYAAMGVVILILLLTYRSPVLWLLPVVSAGVALFTAEGVVYLLAAHTGLVVNSQTAGVLTVLVFGAGTDYALLLVARYREELRRHADRHQAMAVALHRAGPAVLASSSTVIAGMLCLLLAETNSTKGLGPVAAIGVGVGLLAMLTLLPALLVICGRWVFWPVRPSYGSPEPTATGVWAGVGQWLRPRARRVWISTAVLLAIASLGIISLDATGLTNKDSFTTTPDSVVGETVLSQHFPAGSASPVVIVSTAQRAPAVVRTSRETPGMAVVSRPVVSGAAALVQATLSAPPDSQAAYDTIDRLRANVHSIRGADALVGGATAVELDVERAAAHDRNLIIPIVLAVVFLILALLLRALVAPLLLIITVVLSFGAALGISALCFRYLLGFHGADTALPLFVFVFLVALGIDYNIFLMTRVREESLALGSRRGALVGLGATGGVITSAGLVLAGTFSVLATLPMVAFAEIGFAVAFGVLLDTIVVRSILVTSLNLDFGRHMWWPSRLSRRPEEPLRAAVPSEVTAG